MGFKAEHIFVGLIILGGLGFLSTIFLIAYEGINNSSKKDDFCQAKGMEYGFDSKIKHYCYKIENDQIIKRRIDIIDGQVYWESSR